MDRGLHLAGHSKFTSLVNLSATSQSISICHEPESIPSLLSKEDNVQQASKWPNTVSRHTLSYKCDDSTFEEDNEECFIASACANSLLNRP